MNRVFYYVIALMILCVSSASAFDHSHAKWDALLKKYVVLINDGKASRVRYAAFKKDHTRLKQYLHNLTHVDKKEFSAWEKEKQLSFLINAYNAYTIDLILSKYPLRSIKDIGTTMISPWRKKFIRLFGKRIHLDGIEHDLIRKPGVYDEPLIHVVLVCAAKGCPPLRNEAFVPERLNEQLEDNLVKFLSDKRLNRFNFRKRTIEASEIFKWYGGDFSKGFRDYDSLESFFAKHADLLTDIPKQQDMLKEMKAKIKFLEYDWSLNDF